MRHLLLILMLLASHAMAIEWTAIGTEVVLDDTDAEFTRDIEAAIQAIAGLDSVTVEAFAGDTWRIEVESNSPNYYLSEYLLPTGEIILPAANQHQAAWGDAAGDAVSFAGASSTGRVLSWMCDYYPTELQGISLNHRKFQIDDAAAWVESETGQEVTATSWPFGAHDIGLVRYMHDYGVDVVRAGSAGFLEPSTGWEHGAKTDLSWMRSWSEWVKYGVTGCPDMTDSFVETLGHIPSAAAMDSVFNHTADWNTAHPAWDCYLYDDGVDDNLLDQWARYHTWVQIYTHGHPQLPDSSMFNAEQLGWIMDVIIADGRFWIDDLSTIGAYAAERHELSDNTTYVYTPTAGNECADGEENGCWGPDSLAAALTMSIDMEYYEAIGFADTLAARDLRMSLMVSQAKIGAEPIRISWAEWDSLKTRSNIDFCISSYDDDFLFNREALVIKNGHSTPRKFEIYEDGDTRKIRFWEPATDAWNGDITELDGFEGMWIAEDLDKTLLDGAAVVTWAETTGELTALGQSTSGYRPTLEKNELNTSMSVVRFDGTDDSLEGSTSEHFGSNTDGLTLFAVAKAEFGTADKTIIAKGASGDSDREFRMDANYGIIYDGLGGLTYGEWGESGAAWHIVIQTWVPGEGVRLFLDGYTTPVATGGNMAAMNLSGTTALRVGAWRHNLSSLLDGDIACVGGISKGFATSSAELGAIYNTLKDHYGF